MRDEDAARHAQEAFIRYQRIVAGRPDHSEGVDPTVKLGDLLARRRMQLGMSMSALSLQINGYPSASVISKIEVGKVLLTRASATKLGAALRLPRDMVLNGAGLATDGQITAARGALLEE